MDLMHGESFREVVYFDGEFYLLDMRYTLDAGNECMAFRCDFEQPYLIISAVKTKPEE